MVSRKASEKVCIRSRKQISTKTPANTFLVLYGTNQSERDLMFSQKEKLKSLGFTYFRPTATYSLLSARLTSKERHVLARMGVDLNGYDTVTEPVAPEPVIKASGASVAHSAMEKMHTTLAAILKRKTKTSDLIDSIERMIEEVARGTDEAAKQGFIRDFLDFSSRFYTYSAYNQMLIWIQTKGNAQFIAGAKKWERDFGRRVSHWDQAVTILAPSKFRQEVEDTDTGEKEVKEIVLFRPIKVFDVSATVALPDRQKAFEPMSRKIWSKDGNQDSDKILNIVTALKEYARSEGILVTMERMDPEKGGHSAGGQIVINRTFRGINLLSTFVHELSHELLHWKSKKGKSIGRKQKEIDAEATAYIVLKHFECETKDATNYLALWRANGDDVRARRNNIQKAAMEIIEGIETRVGGAPKAKRLCVKHTRKKPNLIAI